MLHSASQITRQLLVDLAVAGAIGADWPASYSAEPNLPDNCITVYDTGGEQSGRSMPTGESLRHFGIQVRVRSTKHNNGYAKAEAIHDALCGVLRYSVVLDSTPYIVQCYSKVSNVLVLGNEKPSSGRHIFTLNALVSIRAQ